MRAGTMDKVNMVIVRIISNKQVGSGREGYIVPPVVIVT
jgi:hypothetical protein